MEILQKAAQLEDIANKIDEHYGRHGFNSHHKELEDLKSEAMELYESLVPLVRESYKRLSKAKQARASRKALHAIHEQGYWNFNEPGAVCVVASFETGMPVEVYGIAGEFKSIAAAAKAIVYEHADPAQKDGFIEFAGDAYLLQPQPHSNPKLILWQHDGRGVFRRCQDTEDINIPKVLDTLVGHKVFVSSDFDPYELEPQLQSSNFYETFKQEDADKVKAYLAEFIKYSPMP
ncbi:hypothetical protein KY328_00680 [Candidatus Woesearchaeota archaeon]|nr:hypothetical protein [Candidatus Woesearchaeota archaeon]